MWWRKGTNHPLWLEESPPTSSERGGLPPAQSQTCRLPFWLTKCHWWHKHKAAQSIKWAPLSSLAPLCLKWIKNGSATWSFQVKSVLKWLYWSSSACLWKLAMRAHAWDTLLLCRNLQLCVIAYLVIDKQRSLGSSHWTRVFRVDEYLIWSAVRGFCLIGRIWDRVRKPD